MSSPLSSAPNGNISGYAWPQFAPYLAPPIAAGLGIIPNYRWFVIKSALQAGEKPLQMSFKQNFWSACEAAPKMAAIMGIQVIFQKEIEASLKKKFSPESPKAPISYTLASCGIVAFLSSPGYLAFNGQTLGQTTLESWRGATIRQVAAIVVREKAVLAALSLSKPISEKAKSLFGDNPAVVYGSTFAAGAFGAVVGHGPDTFLTRDQKKIPLTNWRQLSKGIGARTVGVAGLTVTYKIIEDALKVTP